MNFIKHSDLEGKHAFLGASQYHWINYTPEKLAETYTRHLATMRGTILHDFAAQCILLGQKLEPSEKTLNMYVNDAIGFGLKPEVLLYFSDNCFGTADAINFDLKKKFLRIHDLKTGTTLASMNQLYIYAALFCLEYDVKPKDIEIETRIYQLDDIKIDNPGVDTIVPIMDKIKEYDKIIENIKKEAA